MYMDDSFLAVSIWMKICCRVTQSIPRARGEKRVLRKIYQGKSFFFNEEGEKAWSGLGLG